MPAVAVATVIGRMVCFVASANFVADNCRVAFVESLFLFSGTETECTWCVWRSV